MVKKVLQNNSKFFLIILILLAFCGNVKAQCSIATTNASALNSADICTTFFGCTTVYVGNGTTAATLTIDAGLNFTCLGAINLVVMNNATIVFGNGATDKLTLAEYSTITINAGGSLSGGNNCTASDRIVIGTDLVSTCDGHANTDVSFADLVSVGGTGSAISNSPVCFGNTINLSATPPPEKGPYTYSWSGPGLSPTPYSTSSNYTLSASVSGDYVVNMKSTILNPTPNPDAPYIIIAQAKVIVNPSMSTTPTVASATAQPTCTLATGTITVTQPPTGSGMKYSINGLTYTNTTGVFSSLAAGTYSVTAKNSSGCISNATSVTIKGATNIWNGSAWSNITEPIITENIEFAGDYNSSANLAGINLSGCSCTVKAGVSVNIYSGHTLILTNGLTVDTPGFGDITFFDGASLLQSNTNPSINSGDIDYQRSTNTAVRATDYVYWSSPVTNQDLGFLSIKTKNGTYYSYNSSTEDWNQVYTGTMMAAGKGYIVRSPDFISGIPVGTAPYTASFVGLPNNGDKSISGIIADKSYLLGNPYPSAINADTFLADNAGVLNGTLYFWTHNTAIQPANAGDLTLGSGAYAYTSNDYATYNATGGVGAAPPDLGASTSPAPSASTGGINNNTPNGKIAAGQGFFASTKTTLSGTSIVFNNSMRIAGNNFQFFKSRNPKVKTTIEKNRVWLNLTNTQGAFKQTLVGYITDATNDYDERFDGESYDGNEFVDFYSVNLDKNLVIQGRALPFDENDEVPLGYRTTINGDFTINIDQADGLLTNQAVYIQDKLTNTVFDLKSGNYTFNTVAGTFNDRFVLRYKDNSTAKTLATANFSSLENKVLVSSKNKQIKINSFAETIDKVEVYDLLGRQIYQKSNLNSNELLISNLVTNRQVLLVKTRLKNGETLINKIIY